MSEKTNSSLLDALSWYDEDSRSARVKRIEFASSLFQHPGLVSGELVPLSLMEEARVCFVNGLFMASVLCAASVVEHLLVNELEAQGLQHDKRMLGQSLKVAQTAKLFPEDILERMKKLNDLRNPIAHRRDPQDMSTLESRYRSHRIHPNSLLESDARFALGVMYDFFQLVLKPGD